MAKPTQSETLHEFKVRLNQTEVSYDDVVSWYYEQSRELDRTRALQRAACRAMGISEGNAYNGRFLTNIEQMVGLVTKEVDVYDEDLELLSQ